MKRQRSSRRLRRNRHSSLTQTPQRPSGEGIALMIYDLAMSVVLPVMGIAALATVYLVSGDEGLRARAWRLLKLLLRR